MAMTEQHLRDGDPSLLPPDEEEIEKVLTYVHATIHMERVNTCTCMYVLHQ